jgi:nickel-type superoxide dismutase maturation protease
MGLPIFIRRVQGVSMLPSFGPGQLVIGRKPWRELAKGDVVVFEHEGIEKIKRISRVGNRELSVMGDNVRASSDSRVFGAVPESSVLGLVIWPKRHTVAQPSIITGD